MLKSKCKKVKDNSVGCFVFPIQKPENTITYCSHFETCVPFLFDGYYWERQWLVYCIWSQKDLAGNTVEIHEKVYDKVHSEWYELLMTMAYLDCRN